MNSRMNKYYEDSETNNSRYHRNEELYKEINKNSIDNFEVKSNATVLGDNKNEIDVEKIKKILDTKYNETPKRRSIRLEETEETPIEKEITKEYDINIILEKAREKKQDNYEEERNKKLRNTQFDILNNLNLESKEENIDEDKSDDLKKLIDTIAINESHGDSSPLDILSDLKGSENTEVLDGLKEEIEEHEEKIDVSDTNVINSFYTTSNIIKDKDFEDIDDFSKSIESGNTFMKIVIALIVIVFIIGLAIVIKTFYFKS